MRGRGCRGRDGGRVRAVDGERGVGGDGGTGRGRRLRRSRQLPCPQRVQRHRRCMRLRRPRRGPCPRRSQRRRHSRPRGAAGLLRCRCLAVRRTRGPR
ncbi:hypothetical protein F3K43_22535 [Streptomyces sp. LBUM 1476]|nr:hypothetical protein [Streptomyces sp. LBUM 1476]